MIRRAAFGLLFSLLCACAAPPRVPPAPDWLRSELYFSLGDAGEPAEIAQARWRGFLDAQVTPRFPDGLTVFDADGQWRDAGAGAVERLRTRVLVILHEDTPARRADIDAIRAAWKRLTGDQSVLRVSQPAEVSF